MNEAITSIDYYKLGYDSYLECGYERNMSEYEAYNATPADSEAFTKGQRDAFYFWFNSLPHS